MLTLRVVMTAPDESASDATVFTFGDRTVLQLRSQSFMSEEEFGTVILESVPFRTESVLETPAAIAAPIELDPMQRLEEKLDLALRAIANLQQRVESLDATLARVLMR